MNWTISISKEKEKTANLDHKQISADIRKAADLWTSGNIAEAAALLAGVFQEDEVPPPDYFTVYAGKLGKEFCHLIEKLYLLHIEDEKDDALYYLQIFSEACRENSLIGSVAASLVGGKWEQVREKFYDKCPECLFMGGSDEPYSLKLRSSGIVECIPEDFGPNELSDMKYMDGYSRYEGYALVKDDAGAKTKYPAAIQAILKKLMARGCEYFPNLIFPLTDGKNVLETCDQMLDLLELLDHGYHFERISEYVSKHKELFPELKQQRQKMLQTLLDSEAEENLEMEDDELILELDPDSEDGILDLDPDLEDGDTKRKPKRSGRKKS